MRRQNNGHCRQGREANRIDEPRQEDEEQRAASYDGEVAVLADAVVKGLGQEFANSSCEAVANERP